MGSVHSHKCYRCLPCFSRRSSVQQQTCCIVLLLPLRLWRPMSMWVHTMSTFSPPQKPWTDLLFYICLSSMSTFVLVLSPLSGLSAKNTLYKMTYLLITSPSNGCVLLHAYAKWSEALSCVYVAGDHILTLWALVSLRCRSATCLLSPLMQWLLLHFVFRCWWPSCSHTQTQVCLVMYRV